MKKHITQRRRERLIKLIALKGDRCKNCGMRHHSDVYDFHHRDPKTKKFGVDMSNMTLSWKAILAEAEKCDLLCSNCHRYVHFELRKELKSL